MKKTILILLIVLEILIAIPCNVIGYLAASVWSSLRSGAVHNEDVNDWMRRDGKEVSK